MTLAPALICLLLTAAPQAAVDCPDASRGETALDCPWAGIARKLKLAVDQGHDVGPLVDALLPQLAAQMKGDQRREGLHRLWGRSTNRDENTGGLIVEPHLLAELAARLGVSLDGEVVHSGVQHTYAYLLSLERTPYGYKRTRWVSGRLEAGLGLPAAYLSPNPPSGSLYLNVTYVLGRIALRDHAETQQLLIRLDDLPPALARWEPRVLRITRLEETVSVSKGDPLVLRSDLVGLTAPGGEHTHLLIYSVQLGKRSAPRLVTAFPITAEFAATLIDSKQLGPNRPVRPRYNSHIPSWPGDEMRPGFRRLIKP